MLQIHICREPAKEVLREALSHMNSHIFSFVAPAVKMVYYFIGPEGGKSILRGENGSGDKWIKT